MGSKYMILAKNRDEPAWNNYQTESLVKAIIVLIRRIISHEIVEFTARNFK